MADRKVLHVVPSGVQWAVRWEGAGTAVSHHLTQAAAITAAKAPGDLPPRRVLLPDHRPLDRWEVPNRVDLRQ